MCKAVKPRYTLYNIKLDSFTPLTEVEFEETCRFYKLFKNSEGQWQNGRGDMFVWKENEMSKSIENIKQSLDIYFDTLDYFQEKAKEFLPEGFEVTGQIEELFKDYKNGGTVLCGLFAVKHSENDITLIDNFMFSLYANGYVDITCIDEPLPFNDFGNEEMICNALTKTINAWKEEKPEMFEQFAQIAKDKFSGTRQAYSRD